VKKKIFFEEVRKDELVLDDRMWMIRSSSNRKTLKSSGSQWCLRCWDRKQRKRDIKLVIERGKDDRDNQLID
jgi:hypothetical protein